jgi:hypothetical protein
MTIRHEFVEFAPPILQDGIVYLSIPYCTAIHKCACGCGNSVVTPLSPTDWKLIFDGNSISLDPSIGNWSFKCQSHYWIKNNQVIWAERWAKEKIAAGRSRDQATKEQYYEPVKSSNNKKTELKPSLWDKIRNLFS